MRFNYIGASQVVSGKEFTCHAGDAGSISGLERSCGERNGNTLQYFCLGNPMDRGAWSAPCGHKRVGHNLATKQQQHYCKLS